MLVDLSTEGALLRGRIRDGVASGMMPRGSQGPIGRLGNDIILGFLFIFNIFDYELKATYNLQSRQNKFFVNRNASKPALVCSRCCLYLVLRNHNRRFKCKSA